MNTEEKAKAYDEALEKAKAHINSKGIGDTVDLCRHLFSELRESEDERIRKTLIEALKTSKTVGELKFILPEPTREEALAYLEKQKEPENISASTMIPSFHEELTEFELVLFNAVLDNNFVGAKGSENALAMTKKVAPQLLAIAKKEPDWDREKCFVCQEYEKGFKQGHLEGCTAGYNKAMKEVDEQKEQKPAEWSEEDERILKGIIGLIDHDQHYGVGNKEMLDWLKSLRPQPKQECDEEDEILRVRTINRLETLNFHGISGKEIRESIDWLKSLRPQPHWKPTEEQMKALLKVVDKARELHYSSNSGCDEYDVLRSLYKQLKEL